MKNKTKPDTGPERQLSLLIMNTHRDYLNGESGQLPREQPALSF